MSEDRDADFLREVYSQWGRGDFSRDDMFDPEVEFVMDLPERRTYHGYAGRVRPGETSSRHGETFGST